jgi:hypothetical protein
MRARRLSPALLAAFACALGFACGEMAARRTATPLPPAGSARDDGSGWLARMSSHPVLGGPTGGDRRATAGAYGGASYGGQSYGGTSYGGASYGGTRYGNYRFQYAGPNPEPPAPYRAGYVGGPVVNGGAIEGSIVWPEAPRAPARISPRRPHCPADIGNGTLAIGPGHVVANAVVYLEDITRGRLMLGRTWPYPPPRLHQVGGALEWRDCQLRPHLQVAAPIGATVSASSADQAVSLSGTRVEGDKREPLFALSLGAPGAGREIQLARDGFVEVRPEVGSGGGWIVVAPHPYYVVSDERGRFVLDEVPAGTYTLVVWHEPVVTGVRAGGELVVTPPTLVRRRITIKPGQRQRVVIRLPAAR